MYDDKLDQTWLHTMFAKYHEFLICCYFYRFSPILFQNGFDLQYR